MSMLEGRGRPCRSARSERSRRSGATRLLAAIGVLCWLGASAAQAQAVPAEGEELLDLSIEELLEVEVTSATKSAQSLREAPAVINVITAGQIRDRGYQSVGEALESLPGLDLLHDHYQYNLGVRGISPGARAWSRTVKVMIDGQPVSYRPSQENWLGEELIPIEAVERIEVIKGPASALYGANAYLGVINIITKSGEQVQYGQLAARYGFGARLMDPGASALAGAAAAGVDVIAAGRMHSPALEGYRLQNLPGRKHPMSGERSQSGHPITASGFAKLNYEAEPLGRLSLDVSYQQLARDTEFMDWGVMAHDNHQRLYNVYGRAKYARTFDRVLDWSVGAAVANGGPRPQDRLNVAPGLDTHVERSVGYRGYDVFTDFSLTLRRIARLSAGADYTLDDQQLLNYYTVLTDGSRTLNPPAGTPRGRRVFSNVGVYLHGSVSPFAESRFRSLEALSLIAGIRYDHQNIYGDNVNYSAGAVHQLTRDLYAKLLYGTSFRAPSSNQLYANFINTGGVIGNSDLKPERARTLQLAFGGSFLKRFTFETTGFLTHVESKVEIRPGHGDIARNPSAQNIAAIDSGGLEAALSFFLQDFTSYCNYSFQKSTSTEPNPFAPVENQSVSVPTVMYPSHALKAGVNYKIPVAHVQLNLEGRYIGKRLGSESNNQVVNGVLGVTTQRYALDDYFLLDLYVSSHDLQLWRGRETRVGAKIMNLLDTSYAFPGYAGFDIPGFVRSYNLTLSQQF